ncbi:MAG: copper resistance protein CopC [Chloroflexi bacterium]|nr:copper resistance protein CopC [Chloroflexota bacterium]
MRSARSKLLLLLSLSVLTLFIFAACSDDDDGAVMEKKDGEAMVKEGDTMKKEGDAMMVKLPDSIIAPHFVSSVPKHGEALKTAPDKIMLNFNFNLHRDSSVKLTVDHNPVALGAQTISADEKVITIPITGERKNGVYHVIYKAC